MDYSANSRQVLMVSVDHEILSEATEKLRQFMRGEHRQDWQPTVEAFLALASKRLPGHFRHEEQFVFPAILAKDASAPTVQLIEGLKYGHRDLLADLEELNALFKSPQQDPPREVLWKKLQEFIDDLNEHTHREDYFFGKGYPKNAPVTIV
jgi:iron-sulfur cluster repair protein YtfE (RIC family)